MKDTLFISIVWDFYTKNKRAMPWRDDISPYSIFISEVMLQQTQVARVLIKYPQFIGTFPDFQSLAKALTSDLLSAWQGMGYNRRALYLRNAAQIIMEQYKGVLPSNTALLDELPGIGYATACSIVAFAYDKPVVFIETNIRRVYIHHYFKDRETVSDTDIFPYVRNTVDMKKPREWYWALMDYGAFLAKQIDNPNKRSAHYAKQKKFEGSVREVRGGVLKLLLKRQYTLAELKKIYPDERLFTALGQLEKEGFMFLKNGKYRIK